MYKRLVLSTLLAASALATINGPVITQNFPDPSILTVGGTTYAFSTNSGSVNIQIATSTDGGVTWSVSGSDALPDVGGWATTGSTWAPDVIDRGDGTFVMYYAAQNPTQNTHCIGAATSTNPAGPYNPQAQPLACNQAGGGIIDPGGFQDADGTRYVVYKVDGSSLGGGGPCGNADGSHSTPIMLQKLQGDGLTPTGDPVQILDRDAADGPLVEAPSLILRDGIYVLFFSSNCFNSELYDISWATASSVAGPYTKTANGPFKVTGDNGLTSPGGADPSVDGKFMVFHATTNPDPMVRSMYTANLNWDASGLIVTA